MGKVAFLFAGQGAQYVGMGKELYDQYSCVKNLFDDASERLNINLSTLCFEGPSEELNLTKNTQPAIVTVSLGALRVLRENGVQPDIVAGLSLGEYSALACAGAFSELEAIELVKIRGALMQEAVPPGVGTMAAVLGLDEEAITKVCKEASVYGIVEPANFNCPGQIVIAGEVEAVQKAGELAQVAGAKRVLPLSVSGPFHTSMLSSAANDLYEVLGKIEIQELKVPVITNVTGDFVETSEIKESLKKQVMSSVRWQQGIEKMLAEGVDTFIEVGPGKALSGFVKKINRKVKVYNVEDIKSLESTIAALKEEM